MAKAAVLTAIFVLSARVAAVAGPPYETDDPDPTQYQGYEIYFHVDYHRIDEDIEGSVGTLEINYGLFRNTQFSVDLPETFSPIGTRTYYGFGDLGIGLKYRFIQETATSPQVSFYPSVTVATGDAAEGLGEGHGTLFLPLWAQKSIGPWTIFGGGGLQFDREQSGPVSGWQEGVAITRDLSVATNVGVEIFHSDAVGLQAEYTDIGLGYIGEIGNYHAIVFSGGRAIGPGSSAHGYLAYEWRLGAEAGPNR
jgi:hypothetical protein